MDPINLNPAHYFSNQPRLAASRSPSRSPSRRQHFTNQELNPLLSDLSPSSTLEALQANDLLRTEGKAGKSFIQECVASASTSERAWGIKAALAGKKVREWYVEMVEWAWPGFDQPPSDEPTKTRAQYHQEVHIDDTLSPEAARYGRSNPSGKHNMRGLSSKLIEEYGVRIEMIRDDMETLEIEDLKDYVRVTRSKAGSRRSSLRDPRASFALSTDYEHLDDFTAVITATIIQALPTISRLETLLNIWSTRLLVLREVPSFLVDLDAGRESMVSASIAIGAHNAQDSKRRSDFSRKAFSDIRAVLQDQIAELGRRLDRMLDLLEGSADTLPDAWVDGLDNMENQYSAWVVKAERLAMDKELRVERLEKDYTQNHTDELLDTDTLLGIRQRTSTLDIGAQFDEVRRRADIDFDLTPQNLMESTSSEKAVTGSSTVPSAASFDLEPFPLRRALPEQDPSNTAQSRGPVVHSIDGHFMNGISDGQKMPSLPSKSSHRPGLLMLASSRENVKTPDYSPDAASDTSGSGSTTSNYSSEKSSPEIQSAVVAEYISSPVKVTNPTSLNREHMTPVYNPFGSSGQLAEDDRAKTHQRGVSSDLISKNQRGNGGPGHVRTRSASFQSFERVPKHEIRRIHVQRSGSYSSTLSLSDPEYSQVQPRKFPTSSAPQHGEPEALCSNTSLSASGKKKDQQSSVQSPDPGLGISKQRALYHPPPPVSLKSSVSARSSDRNFSQHLDSGVNMPKQQLLYHQPPPVSVKSPMSIQSSDKDFYTPKQQLPYHSPPAVAPRPAQPAERLDGGLDIAEHRIPYHSPPPVPPRSVHRFEQVSDLGPGSTPVNVRQMKTSSSTGGHAAGHVEKPRTTAALSPNNFDDQLEERISSILTELPTQIRLTSGPEPDAPEVTRFNPPSDPRTPKTGSPIWRLKRTQTSTPLPSMTLAPAQPKSSQSRTLTGESDIKLYHLHQTGKTAPIKLFVRLVGEGGERVMVRIGGGWADLGEYLREYAGHHGRRSVSDSPFDITGLPSSSPLTYNPSPRSRPGSRPASPTPSTRQSPANKLVRQQTSPAIFYRPHTPQSDPSSRTSQPLPWAGTDEVSPSLGLAGPKTKNVDISPRRQAWVDEMMEQARHSGVERKGGSESVVGDLGKVGNTRRVFFKSQKEG